MIAFLSFAIVVLLFTVLVLTAKASEVATELKDGVRSYTNQSRINGYLLLGFLVLMFAGSAYAFKELMPVMIPKAASVHGEKTDYLFNMTMIIILVVAVLTQAALFYFAYRYNESRVNEAYFYAHNNTLEIVWTIIPTIVLTVLIVMGMYEWFTIFTRDRDKNMLVIEATGKQFNWMIRYSGKDGKFGERIIDTAHVTPTNELGINWNDPKSHDDFMSDKLYLVKGRPTLMKLGAQDVIHSFYLPHFRVKMDCVPGTPTEFYFTPTMTTEEMRQYLSTQPWWQTINPETGQPRWQTFKYELACAELCGKSHFGMEREVIVVTQNEYDEWLNKQTSLYDATIKPALAKDSTAVAPVAAGADSSKPGEKKPTAMLIKK
jgi:cytochrome c oxidase subunit 2